MGESQPTEQLATSDQSVEITKRLVTDWFEVPVVTFDLESNRSEPVAVEIVEPVPDQVDIGDIGFHPEYGDEHWSVTDGGLVFECTLRPEGSYSTLYGVHEPEFAMKTFTQGRPTVEIEPLDDESPDPPTLEEQIPETDGLGAVADRESVERSSTSPREAGSPDGTAQAEAKPGARTTGRGNTGDSSEQSSHAAALTAELRNGDVEQERVERLQSELATTTGSTEAQIESLQSEVADLRAYVDALETFLDEKGTGAQLLDEIEDRFDAVEDEMAELRSAADRNEERIERTEELRRNNEGRIKDNAEWIEGNESQIEENKGRIGDNEGRIGDNRERIEALERKFEAVSAWQAQVQSAFRAVQGDIDNGDEVNSDRDCSIDSDGNSTSDGKTGSNGNSTSDSKTGSDGNSSEDGDGGINDSVDNNSDRPTEQAGETE